MKKILIINLIVIFILFSLLEFISYIYIRNDAKEYMSAYNANAKLNNLPIMTQRYYKTVIYDQNQHENSFRNINIGNKNKSSILFFGCSYIFGYRENEENTIPYIINKITDRTTINRGIPGGSILNSIHDLKNESFYEKIKDLPKPEYVIYLFINDHLNRISNPYRTSAVTTDTPFYEINPSFKYNKNNVLEETIPSKLLLPFYSLYTTKAWHFFYAQKFTKDTADDKMLRLLKECKKISEEKWGNIKFVILNYKDGSHFTMSEYLENELKKNNFIVIDTEELVGHELESSKWRSFDNEHPNGDAFKDISVNLKRELKL